MELPLQPNLDKICQNGTYCSSVQDMKTFFACTIGFSGLANSNMLCEFFIEQMPLPWQPNVGKNKPKLQRLCIFGLYGAIQMLLLLLLL